MIRLLQDIVIVGSGGCAREVRFILDRMNKKQEQWNFLGYIDFLGADGVIGDDDWLLGQDREICVIIAVGCSKNRQRIYKKYRQNQKLEFPNIVDPSVIIAREEITLGMGNVICANSVLTTNIKMGNFNIINYSSTIGHDTVISDYVTINPGSNISGNVTLGECTEIGAGTQVLQGRIIEKECIIGAGAVVVDDVAAYSTAVGVPAKVIKNRR